MTLYGGMGRSRDRDSRGGGGILIVVGFVAIAVAYVLAIVLRFAVSRQAEYLADAGSVELTKNPDAMISALRKIENRGELDVATSGVMEMCIDNPREGFQDLFATHPSVDKRVDALVRYAGGHDTGPLAVPQYDDTNRAEDEPDATSTQAPQDAGPAGPFGPASGGGKPFLPARPPIELGVPTAGTSPGAAPSADPGPWGPHGGSR
jgi:heat shock protein HtpX